MTGAGNVGVNANVGANGNGCGNSCGCGHNCCDLCPCVYGYAEALFMQRSHGDLEALEDVTELAGHPRSTLAST